MEESTDVRVLIVDERRKQILLVLEKGGPVELPDGRSFDKPSKWGLPGGRSEPADKDVIDTALREVKEETGVTVSVNEMLRVEKKAEGHTKIVFVGHPADKKGIRVKKEEIIRAKWFPIGILRDPSFPIYSVQKEMALELLRIDKTKKEGGDDYELERRSGCPKSV